MHFSIFPILKILSDVVYPAMEESVCLRTMLLNDKKNLSNRKLMKIPSQNDLINMVVKILKSTLLKISKVSIH